jgi:hypothetical protein
MVTLSGFAVAALLILIWLWLRHRMAGVFRTKNERYPRLEQEMPPQDERGESRQRYADLSLQDKNERDRRIAAALVRKWRRKGLS